MDELAKMLRQIQGELVEQKTELKQMEENITSKIINNLNTKFKVMETKYKELEEKFDSQEKRLDLMEKQLRKKNIMFFGVEEKEKTTKS